MIGRSPACATTTGVVRRDVEQLARLVAGGGVRSGPSVTPLRSKIGRAGWVGERTEGQVDQGCEAFIIILNALVGE